MRTLTLSLAAVLLVAGVSPAGAQAGSGRTVTIELTDVRAGTGDLHVALQTREQFMQASGAHGKVIAKASAGGHVVRLPDVAPGEYAAMIWHDVNGNKRWDSDERGMPVDGWALVNADKLRGMPTFDQVRFSVADEAVTLKLALRYGA